MARQFVQNDTVSGGVDPEILAPLERLVHLVQRMDDDVHRPPDLGVPQDAVLGDVPIMGDVGEIVMIDDNKEVEIRLVAVLRLIDPIVTRV